MAERKYQDVLALLKENPGMSPAEAGRQLGYEQELHWKSKKDNRVGPKHRHSDGARAKAEAIQRGSAPRSQPPIKPGFDRHHKRMIMLYRPLFEGLSDADALALSKHAAAQGMDLGDVDSNYEYLSKSAHNQIHRYMEQQGMRPRDMPDFSKADLNNRKKAFNVFFKDFIQADIDNAVKLLKENGTIRLKRAVTKPQQTKPQQTKPQQTEPSKPNRSTKSNLRSSRGAIGFGLSELTGGYTGADSMPRRVDMDPFGTGATIMIP